MQYPRNFPTLHVKPFLWHDRALLGDLHGRLLHLWKFIWPMCTSLRASAKKVHRKELDINWEKCHFMVQHGIVLGHEISRKGIKVDKAKVEIIAKLLIPRCVKDIRSFFGHAGFYRRFIRDFSKIVRPVTNLLAKDVSFIFDDKCSSAWEKLKLELISAPIISPPD